jgi:hypothetical protein
MLRDAIQKEQLRIDEIKTEQARIRAAQAAQAANKKASG